MRGEERIQAMRRRPGRFVRRNRFREPKGKPTPQPRPCPTNRQKRYAFLSRRLSPSCIVVSRMSGAARQSVSRRYNPHSQVGPERGRPFVPFSELRACCTKDRPVAVGNSYADRVDCVRYAAVAHMKMSRRRAPPPSPRAKRCDNGFVAYRKVNGRRREPFRRTSRNESRESVSAFQRRDQQRRERPETRGLHSMCTQFHGYITLRSATVEKAKTPCFPRKA